MDLNDLNKIKTSDDKDTPKSDEFGDDIIKENQVNQSGNAKESTSIYSFKELIIYMAFALLLAVSVRSFIAAPYIVSGASMEPTFKSWNYLIVDRLTYKFEDPKRGDIIVFKFPQQPSRSLIKRIIGLPGETIQISGTNVHILHKDTDGNNVNKDIILDEPYVSKENEVVSDVYVRLGKDEYFVLGDNRKHSADSRMWGLLKRDKIVGRPFLRIFPFSSMDVLPGEARYKNDTIEQAHG